MLRYARGDGMSLRRAAWVAALGFLNDPMSTESPQPNRRPPARRRAKVAGGRQHSHRVWVTPEEEARLVVLAGERGVTVPRLLYESAVYGGASEVGAREELAKELFAIRRLLANVANNVNQLTRHAHEQRSLPALDEIERTFEQVRAAADDVAATLERCGA